MERKKSGVTGWSIGTAVCALLLAGALFGTNVAFDSAQAINIALKVDTFEVENANEDAVYFESVFEDDEELEAYGQQVAERLHGEGAVLLKNNGALPLRQGASVSTLGRSSANIVTCGTGAADIDTSRAPTLRQALENVGCAVNPTLWDFYTTGAGKDYIRVPGKGVEQGEHGREYFTVAEVPVSLYTGDVTASFATYGDAAIVTISRISGEGADLAIDQYVDGANILQLNQDERALLELAQEYFDTVIVLINATNALECDFLTSGEYDIDAALWIGYTGDWGLNAVADILVGNVNPSGRLVDTYCNDNTTAPAVVGLYGRDFTNYDPADTSKWYSVYHGQLDGNHHYITYQEGIYVGYRYYETRYEDTVMGTGNAGNYDYAAEVAYPFGYGLSYTTFAWSNFDADFEPQLDGFQVRLTVKNTGNVAGKEVVQVYLQSPYTDYDRANGIEKAAVELCGFTKTGLLQPGESERVTIFVPRSELTSYDSRKAKTYILDAGTYYLTAADNAHAAVNQVLSAKGYTVADGMDAAGNAGFVYAYENPTLDTVTYACSKATGYPITNQFDSAELSRYDIPLTYLSRSDWQGTWPVEVELEATEQMFRDGLNVYQTYQGVSGSTTAMPTMGADNGLTLAMMLGKSFDDPQWQTLLDQATFEEMATLIGKGYHNTAAMPSVSKPATVDDNGPQGFTQTLTGVAECHTAYSDENIMAATFNVELMEEVGQSIGNDMLDLEAEGLYGPAMNLHRNAYAGRNFEYYSEDGFLSGAIAAAEVKGIQSRGIYVYLKHFVLNDSETACRCISTWANEQSIRELYLKPFEMAVVDGGAWNVMNSFARLGVVWSGAHSGLMTEVLRNEWGMRGFALTDFSGNSAFASMGIMMKSFDVAHGLLAGTDCWDSSAVQWTDDLMKLYRNDPDIAQAMRTATHRILYTVVNSHAMNGMDADSRVVAVTPWWQTALIVVDVALAALTIFSAVKLTGAIRRRKRM